MNYTQIFFNIFLLFTLYKKKLKRKFSLQNITKKSEAFYKKIQFLFNIEIKFQNFLLNF